MDSIPEIKLYGSKRCHKTNYYKLFFKEAGFPFKFLDVEESKDYANELRNLYTNKRLNYPTITIGNKRLRNPTEKELNKWLNKLL